MISQAFSNNITYTICNVICYFVLRVRLSALFGLCGFQLPVGPFAEHGVSIVWALVNDMLLPNFEHFSPSFIKKLGFQLVYSACVALERTVFRPSMIHHQFQRTLFFQCRAVGGKEAEKEERERWINKERKKIEDSVNGEYMQLNQPCCLVGEIIL